ncbi:MAG: hypothetical protein E7612_09120 [Ruminococcaceae bacterium]|nr:hypothetical protein [Oscillospiraceae bacterium]
MKKSVVILIAVIYVASIAIVSFFGLQYKVFDEVISVERIEVLNEGLLENDAVGKYVIIKPNQNGEYIYHIQYRVYPDNASVKTVDFATDPNLTEKNYSVDDTGLVTIDKGGVAAVIIIGATDGSGIQEKLTIIAN